MMRNDLAGRSRNAGRRSGRGRWLPQALWYPRPFKCSILGDSLQYSWGHPPSSEESANLANHPWTKDADARCARIRKLPNRSGLLMEFLKLAGSKDDRIRRFAAQHGPLRRQYIRNPEPIRLWREYSKLAGSVYRYAKAIRERKGADKEDQSIILDWLGVQCTQDESRRRSWRKEIAASALEKWLREEGFEPEVVWIGDSLQVRPAARFFLGSVGLLLAQALTLTSDVYRCSHCGTEFRPKRRPTTGVRRYCEGCRAAGVPVRDAQRDRRMRQQGR